MQPLVQSAIDAANRGDNNKALDFCKQALTANPNDVDAWLVVAAVVDQPERKRQCLNRVLALDPANQIARDELLDMDRAAMGGTHTPPFISEPVADPPQPASSSLSPVSNYPTSTSAFESEPAYEADDQPSFSSGDPTGTSAFEAAPSPEQPMPITPQAPAKAAAKPSSQARKEKPLVFKSSLLWRILMYFFLAAFGGFGALMIWDGEFANGLVFLALTFLAGIGVMALSNKVEVSEAGIRASGVFGSSAIKWNEIKSIKSSSMKQRLELYKNNGQVVKVSNQVSGYPRIVEDLRKRRPDLFGMASATRQGSAVPTGSEPSHSGNSSTAAPAVSGTRTFRKSFIRQYGLAIALIFFCLFFIWLAFENPKYQLGSLLAIGFFVLVMIATLFQVNAVKVESNWLTIETAFVQKKFSAPQIREIKMQSVRGRYGRVTHHVLLVTTEGKNYPLEGFSGGADILYGFLTSWWNAHKNR